MWQAEVIKLINDWIHKTKLIDSRYWSCPTLDNPMLQHGLSNYNNYSGLNSYLRSSVEFMNYSWGLPRRSGKSFVIEAILNDMNPDSVRYTKYANTHFISMCGLGKLLILIDEYPPTREVLEYYTRGLPKDILIVKLETPKLA